jgi:predicted XRE-type DNA-binding protein
MAMNRFANKAVKERSGVKSQLDAALSGWKTPEIDAATTKSSFKIDDLRKKKMSIYVGVRPGDLDALGGVVRILFEFLINRMTLDQPDKKTEPYDLPEARKKKIASRAEKRIEEYRTLQELRKVAGLTQAHISEGLDMPQSNVSRLEKSSDMLLSTLRSYVEAAGGKLNLTVELPGRSPISLSGLGDLVEPAENGPKAQG